MKPVVQPIASGNVRLRLLTEADLPQTLAWRNQAEVRRWFIYSEKITPEQHHLWFEKYQKRDNDLVFIIEETGDLNRLVGQVALYDIDAETLRAEFGRLLIGDPAAREKKLAIQASALILDFGFQNLSLDEIYLEVFSDNLPAIHIYRKLGFLVIGHKERLLTMTLSNPYRLKQT